MKRVLALIAVGLSLTLAASWASAQTTRNSPEERRAGRAERAGGGRAQAGATTLPSDVANLQALSVVLDRPTDKGITVSVLSADAREGYIEYGPGEGRYTAKTELMKLPANTAVWATVHFCSATRPRRVGWAYQPDIFQITSPGVGQVCPTHVLPTVTEGKPPFPQCKVGRKGIQSARHMATQRQQAPWLLRCASQTTAPTTTPPACQDGLGYQVRLAAPAGVPPLRKADDDVGTSGRVGRTSPRQGRQVRCSPYPIFPPRLVGFTLGELPMRGIISCCNDIRASRRGGQGLLGLSGCSLNGTWRSPVFIAPSSLEPGRVQSPNQLRCPLRGRCRARWAFRLQIYSGHAGERNGRIMQARMMIGLGLAAMLLVAGTAVMGRRGVRG